MRIHNRAVGDGIGQPLGLDEPCEFPFPLQWPRKGRLHERIEGRSPCVQARLTVIIVDDFRAFPSKPDVGGPRASQPPERDSHRPAYFITMVVTGYLVEHVELT